MLVLNILNIPSRGSSFNNYQNKSTNETMDYQTGGGHKIVRKLTICYKQTLLNSGYDGENYKIPQRDLTFPNVGVYNDNMDNEECELIVRVHDEIINKKHNDVYVIEDLLGKGTFGQVLKCKNKVSGEQFAIKIIRNIPVYNFQAVREIKLLKQANKQEQSLGGTSRIVLLKDQFIFKNHVCMVFPLHHISLFDFLRETKFKGLQIDLIKRVIREILEGVNILHELGFTHCDLKPENILLSNKGDYSAKIIDLGSAQQDGEQTYFEYVQSLFYRAPEAIIGATISNKIDIWSIGCITAELYLGQPMLAGTSSHEQLQRILTLLKIEDLDHSFIESGQHRLKYLVLQNGLFRIKTRDEFQQDENLKLPSPNKSLYCMKSFDELYHEFDKSSYRTPDQFVYIKNFIDFLKRCLVLNPKNRMSAQEALRHPFLKEEKLDNFSNLFMSIISYEKNYIQDATKSIKEVDDNFTQSDKYVNHLTDDQSSIRAEKNSTNYINYEESLFQNKKEQPFSISDTEGTRVPILEQVMKDNQKKPQIKSKKSLKYRSKSQPCNYNFPVTFNIVEGKKSSQT